MIIFKKVIKYSKEINRNIVLKNGDREAIEILKRKQILLSEIKDFMLSYEWVKHTVTKEKLACFIENDFNYLRIVEDFGVSYDSARASMSQLGKVFEKEIGVGCVDKIMNGNISRVESELNSNLLDFKNTLVYDLRTSLPEGGVDTTLSLVDCRKELSFLQYYSLRRLNSGLDRLDSTKLAHIIGILTDTSVDYDFEKEIIKGYLAGDVKKWEDVEKLLEEVLHYGR